MAFIAAVLLSWPFSGCGSEGNGEGGTGTPPFSSPGPSPASPPPATPSPAPRPTLTSRLEALSLDPTFATEGVAVLPLSDLSPHNYPIRLTVDDGGRIVVVGQVRLLDPSTPGGTAEAHTTLIRLERDGEVDRTFGQDGVVSPRIAGRFIPCPLCFDTPTAVATLSGGRLLVAASVSKRSNPNSETRSVLLMFEADGRLDADFGDDGILVLDLGGRGAFVPDRPAFLNDFVPRPDGGLVALGSWGSGPAAVRFAEDVTIDQEFGDDGLLPVDIGGAENLRFWTGTALPDGRVLAIGGGSILGTPLFIDAATGDTGEWTRALDLEGFPVPVGSLGRPSLDGKGRIAIAYDNYGPFIGQRLQGFVRFGTDLSLDPEFGDAGVVELGFRPVGLLAQPDDAILVLGSFDDAVLGLVRYDGTGRIDRNFGDDGTALADAPGTLLGWVEPPDGKLLTLVQVGDEIVLMRWVIAAD